MQDVVNYCNYFLCLIQMFGACHMWEAGMRSGGLCEEWTFWEDCSRTEVCDKEEDRKVSPP